MLNNIHKNSIDVDCLREYIFPIHQFDLSRRKIERIIGYTEENIAPESVNEIIENVFNEIRLSEGICGGFKIICAEKVSFDDEGFSCGGLRFDTWPAIASCLKASSLLGVFIATAGKSFDKLSQKYMAQDDLVHSYVVDIYGSVIAEQAAEKIHILVGNTASEEGMKITNRYSPGYCNWDVAEQHKLFSLLPEKFCGVTLTDSALMTPVKSVSGVIGVGKDVEKKAYGCDFCDVEDCTLKAGTHPL